MEYLQRRQFSREGKFQNEFLNSDNDGWHGHTQCDGETEPLCLKTRRDNIRQNYQNLSLIQFNWHEYESSDKVINSKVRNKFRRENLRNNKMETVSDEEIIEGPTELGKHRVMNDYKLMNDNRLNKWLPDMTRSLSYTLERGDARLGHLPRDRYKRSHLCASQQVSNKVVIIKAQK